MEKRSPASDSFHFGYGIGIAEVCRPVGVDLKKDIGAFFLKNVITLLTVVFYKLPPMVMEKEFESGMT